MRSRSRLRCALGWFAYAATAIAQTEQRDWSRTATEDLIFIKKTLDENHPVAVDPDSRNRAYRDFFEQGYKDALSLAARARSYAGYFFAISSYTVGFQDNHMYALRRNESLSYRWPGFLVSYEKGEFRAHSVEERMRKAGLSEGDLLLDCDGRAPGKLAEERIKTYIGRWNVAGERKRLAPSLLVEDGNPFVVFPRKCTFRNASGSVSIPLDLEAIPYSELTTKIDSVAERAESKIELRDFGTAGYWLSLSSFASGNPERAAALASALKDLEAKADAVRRSRVLVLDVRGNGGGASVYGERVANILWGADYIRKIAPVAHAVDWRASPDNLRYFEQVILPRFKTQLGEKDPTYLAYVHLTDGLRKAIAENEPFYRQDEADFYPPPREPGLSQPLSVAAKVFVLTDGGCASACLDFVDLLKATHSVIQVGTETSADGIYIDNRSVPLPSGFGNLGVSMKVYRDRLRGHNEAHIPEHVWSGHMNDTPALERWIETLASGPKPPPATTSPTGSR